MIQTRNVVSQSVSLTAVATPSKVVWVKPGMDMMAGRHAARRNIGCERSTGAVVKKSDSEGGVEGPLTSFFVFLFTIGDG